MILIVMQRQAPRRCGPSWSCCPIWWPRRRAVNGRRMPMQGTRISWTEGVWNPVRGCSQVSEGCRHCYAMRIAARFSGPGQPSEGFAKWGNGGPAHLPGAHQEGRAPGGRRPGAALAELAAEAVVQELRGMKAPVPLEEKERPDAGTTLEGPGEVDARSRETTARSRPAPAARPPAVRCIARRTGQPGAEGWPLKRPGRWGNGHAQGSRAGVGN